MLVNVQANYAVREEVILEKRKKKSYLVVLLSMYKMAAPSGYSAR